MSSKIFNLDKGKHVWQSETICELHRQIYDLLFIGLYSKDKALYDAIIVPLEKVYICGIKMTKKMLENKLSLPDWEKHETPDEIKRLRELRIHLTEKLNEIGNSI